MGSLHIITTNNNLFIMKKKSFLLSLILSLQFVFAFAKDFEYEGYNWTDNRKINTISATDEKEQAIILKDKRAVEFVYNEKGEPEVYRLVHKIIRVNTDEAIENYNTVYISMQDVIKIVELKVRVITKAGKSIELNKDNIKEVENLENAGLYKIFAIEGAEKNCEIEYFYILHSTPTFYSKEVLQSGYISRNVDFELISPINLTFVTKSYNGLPDAVRADTVGKMKQTISLNVKEIPALKVEEFSTYNANKWKINYKLDANGKKKLFKWSTEAKEYYEKVYYWENEKALKPVDKLLKTIGTAKAKSEEEKVILIENYIKNNIVVNDNVGRDGFFIETIIEKKTASKFGLLRLMAAALTKEGIKHQLVLTSDRSEEKFDPKFEYYGFLDNFLIYIESLDKYIAPYETEYRYPFFPHYWSYNYGMFVKPVVAGEMKTAIDVMKFIPALDYKLSYHNHYIDLTFKPSMDGVKVKYKTTMSGYSAVTLQPFISLLDEAKKKEIGESLVKSSAEDAKVSNLLISNYDMNTNEILKPLTITADFESSTVVEKAGIKYILKVGELIGRQSELYQDTKRQKEAENAHNHGYDREINITIPDGYKVTNINDLNMDVFYEDKGERTMAFTSKFVIEGNVIKITVNEYYKTIVYPLAIFENFRKVINAAADFNKIALVFEKK